jgi:hypothetical protein
MSTRQKVDLLQKVDLEKRSTLQNIRRLILQEEEEEKEEDEEKEELEVEEEKK